MPAPSLLAQRPVPPYLPRLLQLPVVPSAPPSFTYWNSFESGTNGVNIGTANSSGQVNGEDYSTPFTAVQDGTGATNVYSNTQAAHGNLSAELATGSTSTTAYVQWNAPSPVPVMYYRFYCFLPTAPSATFRLLTIGSNLTSAQVCMYIEVVNSSNVLKMNSNSGATIITTTNAVNIGSWFRIEGWVYGNATSGQAQLSLYNTMDSTTATETDTSPATENTFGTPQLARFGIGASIATVGPFYMDDLGLSSVGLLGPSLYSGSASAAVTLAVTATGSSQRSGIPSGAVTLAAAAAGSSRRSGTPSGAASLSASAVATRRQSGSVTGAVSLSATAAGQSRRSGSPGAAITIAATAAGQSQRSGVAAAAVLLAVTCTGGVPGPVAAFIAGYPRFRWNAGSPQTRWQSGYPLLRWPAGQ